jgi:hypothetical protein
MVKTIPSFVLGRLNASTYQTRGEGCLGRSGWAGEKGTPRRSNSLRPCRIANLNILSERPVSRRRNHFRYVVSQSAMTFVIRLKSSPFVN